ncbi:hypothetical protein ACFQU7_33770 [Pseudoroseomonas wenyumeiae]
MRRAEETPEGLLAEWVARGAMDEAELALALTTLSARIAGFSRQWMLDMAKARRAGAPQVAR